MAGHVTNLVTKFEHPMPIRSWFMSYNVSLWLLHCECIHGHCACAESRDPWVGGLKQLHFWNSRPLFAYSLYNFSWATTTIKGRLLSSVANAKALDCINFLCVTLWPWPLTFDLLTFNSYHTWRVTWPTLPPSLKTLRLFVHELRVITFPIEYHWKCVRGHCVCAESRDPWVGVKNNYIFGISDPDLPIHYTTSYWVTKTIKGRLLSSRPM